MARVFEIPCNSEQEAMKTAKQINDVSPANVTAEALERPTGWIVRVTVS